MDKPQLQETLSIILSQYDIKPALVMNGHPDLAQKIKLFLAGKRLEGLSPLSLKGYELELKIFAEHVPKAANEITTADIRVYLSEFERLKTSSLSKRLSVLKSMFGWLVNEDILTRDPTKQIKPPKKEQRSPKALTIEELEMIREACITPRERALVEVLYATGGRLSEIRKMNHNDIDYQALSVLVIGKGNKERPVYFSFKAMYHLRKYLMRRTDNDPALFVSERKPYRRLSDRGIQREVKVVADRSEVTKNVHPHIFRHTFATLMLNNGADLVAVQGLLGHTDPATTQIYASMTNEKRKQSHHQYLVQ
ncbi:site-specific tyrosine recombinase/integron integrase [Desulfosporosinus sp. OT]|uniref:site-specific tyrosine recombinase/integron integrase n=1 Tax=Desulfosporosinus sp. OT TaxID=913865 RepID=UPI00178C73B2|nr:site-specific tyrosine recombinase/integron integrase [Desulfosporosinus sp. OT]